MKDTKEQTAKSRQQIKEEGIKWLEEHGVMSYLGAGIDRIMDNQAKAIFDDIIGMINDSYEGQLSSMIVKDVELW